MLSGMEPPGYVDRSPETHQQGNAVNRKHNGDGSGVARKNRLIHRTNASITRQYKYFYHIKLKKSA
jgi:hypothetical protein